MRPWPGFEDLQGVVKNNKVEDAKDKPKEAEKSEEAQSDAAEKVAEPKMPDAVSPLQDSSEVSPEAEEKLKTVPRSRMGMLVDTIKLHTVDKWAMAWGRRKNEGLVGLQQKKIERNQKQKVSAEQRLQEISAHRASEETTFNKAITGLKTASLREMFEGNKRDALSRVDALAAEQKAVIENFGQKETTLQESLKEFNDRIAHVETVYANKIESHIQTIKEQTGYKEELERNTQLSKLVQDFEKSIDENQNTVDDLEKALAYKNLLTKEQVATCKEKLGELRGELSKQRSQLELYGLEPLRASDAKLEKINARIKKWEDLKPRKHEDLSEAVVSEISHQKETEKDSQSSESTDRTVEEVLSGGTEGPSEDIGAGDYVEAENDSDIEDREAAEKEEAIQEVKNFDELYIVIGNIGEIKSLENGRVFKAKELIDLIDHVRQSKPEKFFVRLNRITRTFNLRKKVEKLLQAETKAAYNARQASAVKTK